jgi:molecular chaperone GrpE
MARGIEGKMSLNREEILRRFEAWLDQVLASEDPPQGIAAELLSSLTSEAEAPANGRCDQYSMWAAVTALTQEVKLQGRSFKQLSETLAPVADLAPQLPEMQREAQQRARREMLDVLLDLRDRLSRGLDAARECSAKVRESMNSLQSGWMARLRSGPAALREAAEGMAALEKGYQMSLERLDDVLAEFDVHEIACRGEVFDPNSMHAVDVEESAEAEDGAVIDVYRAGYEWKGEVYRPAQVKVARRPATAFSGEDENE